MRSRIMVLFALVAVLGALAPATAQTTSNAAYPVMAPFAQYAMASQTEEAALARSAAPTSISHDAEIMALGDHGYVTVAKGANGFVCMVQRSWASGVRADEFWNPKLRGPICFNPASARSVMPQYLERTRWVLAGASRSEIERRIRATVAAGNYVPPETGAMAFMISRGGYLGDAAGGPWHPHLMFFQPASAGGPEAWGANLDGAPLLASTDPVEPVTTFFIPVAKWSDGSEDGGPSFNQMHMQ
jgi:hypothetical protein